MSRKIDWKKLREDLLRYWIVDHKGLIDWKKLREDLLRYWIVDHKGLGLKRHQFLGSGINEHRISRILRELRHERKVAFGGGAYWVLTHKTYQEIKEKYGKSK